MPPAAPGTPAALGDGRQDRRRDGPRHRQLRLVHPQPAASSTEVFYPFVDTACTRDLGLLVTDGKEFFSEEKRGHRPRR